MSTEVSYTVESYALYIGVTDSIKKLNPIIKRFGYQFIDIDLAVLEKEFSGLFTVRNNFQNIDSVGIHDVEISIEFLNLIQNHPLFGVSTLVSGKVIFLKKIEDFELKVVDNAMPPPFNELSNFNAFNVSLIRQLRLFKRGEISSPLKFQIIADTRKIIGQLANQNRLGHDEFEISDSDVTELTNYVVNDFVTTTLTDLAIKSFELSYEIADVRVKYTTLMTSLECLFNTGADQITHTISRHLSLILSKNEREFQENYKKIKTLYRYRSQIVHGGDFDMKVVDKYHELQEFTRKAIKYCLGYPFDKQKLFETLNAKGFA